MRIYIFSGWLGRPLSMGMFSLMPRLAPYGTVQFLPWKQADAVYGQDADEEPIAVIGYSQGACNLAWLDQGGWRSSIHRAARCRFDLGIAYDPRGGDYGLSRNGVFTVSHFNRLVCYHNTISTWYSTPYKYEGSGVETVEIDEWHPMVQLDRRLHDRTVEEVRKLATVG